MKILFVAHRLPYPPNKGDKIRSFQELQDLSARHDVDLFCFYDDAEDVNSLPLIRRFCQNLYAERLSPWRSRLRAAAALVRGKPFTPAYFYSRTMAMRIQEALRTRNYDLAFVFSSSMAQYVPAGFPIPRILDMVDVDSDKWAQFAVYRQKPLSWVWRHEAIRLARLEAQLLNDFEVTFVCTPAEAQLLKKKAANPSIAVLENTLDTEYFDPAKVELPTAIAKLQPYLVFTGSMDYFPNVDAVIRFHQEVFTRVAAFVPNVRLVIAGRNPSRAVRNLGKDPQVFVTGSVPDIRPYLLGAHAAVAPMRIARGVQYKILEAMAMGLQVAVSTRAASALPPDLASQLLTADDSDRMAELLVGILHQTRPVSESPVRDALLVHFQHVCRTQSLEEALESVLRLRHRSSAAAAACASDPSGRPSTISARDKKQTRSGRSSGTPGNSVELDGI